MFLSFQTWSQVNPNAIRQNMGNLSNLNLDRNRVGNNNTSIPPNSASSQDSTKNEGDEEGMNGIEYVEEPPDSVLQSSVFIFHRDPIRVKIMEVHNPTISPTGAQFHDMLDALNGDYYLSVSELGHQHYSIFPSFSATPGLIYRNNMFPGFYKTPENINFYQALTPYEVLSYNSSLNEDYQVHFTHTQNINEHWNYAIDYHLFNPKGSFTNSSATNNLLDINTNYYSHDARYQLSAGVIWQRMVIGENGGLSNPDIYFNKPNAKPNGLPMLFTDRFSTSRDMTVFVKQSYNTVRQFEWYRPIKEKFIDTVVNTLRNATYDTSQFDSIITYDTIYTYNIIDSIVGYDTIQPHKAHTYNTGVFALDLQWDRQRYRCVDSTDYNQLSANIFWTNDAYMDHKWRNPVKLYGGIRPQVSWLKLNEAEYSAPEIHQVALYPFGRLEISPWKASELNVYAEAAPDLSEYNLDATLVFPFRDSIGNSKQNITLRGVAKAYSPELIYTAECMRINHPVADPLMAVGVRKLEANYHREDHLDVFFSANHISHNTWFTEVESLAGTKSYAPTQSQQSALLLQARLNLYLHLGWFHYDMQQMVQYSTDQDQVRVPLFASKNSVYADFYLFKNALRAQIGIDARYHTEFYADAYDPTLGIFYRQDATLIGNYLWADAFVNLQIKRATIYAKAGHVNAMLEQRHSLIIPNYPSKQFGLFFGLTWKFFD